MVSTMPSNLIAQHLHGKGNRKAPECGAYTGVIHYHRGGAVHVFFRKLSNVEKKRSISSSEV